MKVGLFIPCYIDVLYPQVGIATYTLLKRLKVDIVYPMGQTCCGQPMANSGYEYLACGTNKNFIQQFKEFDKIVAPSGSCVLHIKEHLKGESDLEKNQALHIQNNIYELTEFLTDVVKVENLKASFPHKVGFHQSCHGQRGLHLSGMSELTAPYFSKPEQLLQQVEGIEWVKLDKKDECCGFGGTFCVTEETVSSKMGKDRLADHEKNGAEYITACDMSCLMHLEGIANREKSHVKVIHIAEILNTQNAEQ
ncbi:Fe-S oxidoreductase [Chryseobacterium lactis]|uniref:(Fe-S)-binding protein n=1 Tax=Chryseobacterium lactis TaxID=1241981 RepID=A0A3G6RTK6_CHRLC|nr:(Fe-S)-binding protein [Chryseobacterium lactis]AZA84906.1 (Fe-S)-binding protein [Chryseobacterium lactis]AZB05294.1 (Fe-S)-binding protein [Chryseobacterium lactis]PNW12277.1 Fe-S oxidoreductase [Chryseobacterium lactis]